MLADLAGEPVVWHVHRRLAGARLVDEVVVATDSDEVADVVRGLGGTALVVDGTYETGSDRVAAVARDREASIVVNLQADQPLIASEDIDRTLGLLEEPCGFDLTTLAFRSDDRRAFDDPHVVKVVAAPDGRALYFSRAPVPGGPDGGAGSGWYLHHVGLYCFRREALERFASLGRTPLEQRESLEQLRALEHGMSIGVALTDRTSWSIDRPEDLEDVAARLDRRDRR